MTDPAEELQLRRAAAQAAGTAGLFEDGDAHYIRGIELATQLGDMGIKRRAIAGRASLLIEGHQEQGRQILVDALGEPGLEPADPGYVELAGVLANFEMRLGNYDEAVAIADRALPAMELAGDDDLTVDTLISRGVALANLGRTTEATVTLTGAKALAERRGMLGATLRAAINLGYALESEDPVLGFQVSKDGYERAARYGMTWAMRYLLGNSVDGAFQIGEWDWALRELTQQLGQELELRERLWFETHALLFRVLRGEAEEPRADGERMASLAAAFDDVQYHVGPYAPRIYDRLLSGELTDGIALVDEALRLGLHAAELAPIGALAATWAGDAGGGKTDAGFLRHGAPRSKNRCGARHDGGGDRHARGASCRRATLVRRGARTVAGPGPSDLAGALPARHHRDRGTRTRGAATRGGRGAFLLRAGRRTTPDRATGCRAGSHAGTAGSHEGRGQPRNAGASAIPAADPCGRRST